MRGVPGCLTSTPKIGTDHLDKDTTIHTSNTNIFQTCIPETEKDSAVVIIAWDVERELGGLSGRDFQTPQNEVCLLNMLLFSVQLRCAGRWL